MTGLYRYKKKNNTTTQTKIIFYQLI